MLVSPYPLGRKKNENENEKENENLKRKRKKFDWFNRSPLQSALYERNIDMIRIFLKYGADTDHIDANGWSSLFYLWAHDAAFPTPVANTDLLHLLSVHDPEFDLSHQDIWGWTVLQRLVIDGTDDDLAATIALSHLHSADVDVHTLNAIMEAAAYAISQGQVSKFATLVPHVKNIDGPLRNSWTLLEMAAYHGRDGITRRLLDLGAVEFYFDGPYFPARWDGMAAESASGGGGDDDDDKAEDVGWGVEQFRIYLDALVAHGRVRVDMQGRGTGGDVEVYWEPD